MGNQSATSSYCYMLIFYPVSTRSSSVLKGKNENHPQTEKQFF
uniref:Uncharacterized protein n=1 Tax=Arundo donax TaxID=35708 RepID=A0A0A9HMU0_ARUDO